MSVRVRKVRKHGEGPWQPRTRLVERRGPAIMAARGTCCTTPGGETVIEDASLALQMLENADLMRLKEMDRGDPASIEKVVTPVRVSP